MAGVEMEVGRGKIRLVTSLVLNMIKDSMNPTSNFES